MNNGQWRRMTIVAAFLVGATTGSAQESLSVKDAVRQAVQKNYDIIIAADEAEAARRADSWAMAGAYPTAAAGASINTARVAIDQQFSSGTTARQRGVEQTAMQAFANVQWRVFDGMRMFATKERLAEIRERGESALRQRVAQTIVATMSAYYALVQSERQLQVTESQRQLVMERKAIAEVRVASGLSARSDVLQARIDVNDVQSSLLSLKAQRRVNELVLLNQMGRDTAVSIRCTDEVIVDTTIDVSELRARLLQANESVIQAVQDIRISRAAKRETASAGYPGIDLQAGYVYNRAQNSAGFALFNENNGFSVGANLSVPLLNGFRTDAETEQQELEIRRREHTAENVRRSVAADFESTAEEYRSACAMLAMLRESTELAKENSTIAMERFKRNDITGTEIRASQLEVLQRTQNLLLTTIRAKSAEIRLRMLAGALDARE